MKSVLIVGLHGKNAARTQQLTEHLPLKLRFDEAKHNEQLKGSPDLVVLMIRFVSHLHTKFAHQLVGRDRTRYACGGVSELVKLLESLE
mgnify:CR=1 FL=1